MRCRNVGDFGGGWSLINEDLSMTKRNSGMDPLCFNANSKTFGSFAVIYHRSVYKAIIEWTKKAKAPFDHIFSDLAHDGYTTRVAFPWLAAQDVRHRSQIDPGRKRQSDLEHRAKIHRWDLSSLCDPATHLPFATIVDREDHAEL